MTKSIVIGDLHLRDKGYGYIEHQVKTIVDTVNSGGFFAVVFLGDVFDKRKPTPTELIRFNDILSSVNTKKKYVIRGNHESETRSDNGVTVLSLFHNPNKGVHIYEHTGRADHKGFPKTTFVPHYEDTETIIESLEHAPDGDLVFGHFGYTTGSNSFRADSASIPVSNFNNFTILGHIHRYSKQDNVMTLGTPYQVNFGEHNKDCFYGVIHHDEQKFTKFTKRKVKGGLRHIVCSYEDLGMYQKYYDNPNYYTLVKLLLTKLDENTSFSFKNEILEKYNIDRLDMSFAPIIEQGKRSEDVSMFSPKRHLFKINEVIINDYIDNNITSLDREDIEAGYKILSE